MENNYVAPDFVKIAKELRAHMLAIAVDAEMNRIPVTTSSTTGVAGRINAIINDIDNRTYRILTR